MLRTFRLIDAAALSAVGLWLGACADSSAPTAPKDQFRTELITCQASVSARTLDCAASQPQAARGVSFDLVLGGQGEIARLREPEGERGIGKRHEQRGRQAGCDQWSSGDPTDER